MAHGKAWMAQQKRCWPTCYDCFEAYRKAVSRACYRRETGTSEKFVEIEKYRKMVNELIDVRGWHSTDIAKGVGVNHRTIQAIRAARSPTVYLSTSKKIEHFYHQAVTQPKRNKRAKGVLVDATLARFASQGLAAQGYTNTWIGAQVGASHKTIRDIQRGVTEVTKQKTLTGLIALAKEVGSREGPSGVSRARALAKGWKPTMYHDELV